MRGTFPDCWYQTTGTFPDCWDETIGTFPHCWRQVTGTFPKYEGNIPQKIDKRQEPFLGILLSARNLSSTHATVDRNLSLEYLILQGTFPWNIRYSKEPFLLGKERFKTFPFDRKGTFPLQLYPCPGFWTKSVSFGVFRVFFP